MTKSLPVLLYHYVSSAPSSIAVTPQRFEEHCRAMAERGYRGVSLEDAAAFLLRGERLPHKSVLITFDDGFLDNYIYAAPILSQYGHRATVFAVADRLEHGGVRQADESLRRRLDEPWTTDELGNRQRADMFMSWDEARAAESAGVLDIAGHSLSHAPVWGAPPLAQWRDSPQNMELHTPGARHRTFDRPEQPMPWGLPLLPELPGLANRAFVPSAELMSLIESRVPQQAEAAAEYLADQDKAKALRTELLALPLEQWGRRESTDEHVRRVRSDLSRCKELIEEQLGDGETKPLTRRCLAWPWGKYTPLTLEIAREVGYEVFFCTSFGANFPGRDPRHVHRFKARDKGAGWLLSRIRIYSSPLLARLYAAVRI